MKPLISENYQPAGTAIELGRPLLRYINVRRLIENESAGNVSAFAEKIGKTREILARAAGKKYNPAQRIGDKLAEDIESALGLPTGYLDRFHALPREIPDELRELLNGAPERQRSTALPRKTAGMLPIVPWESAASVFGVPQADLPDADGYMLSPVECKRGFFLAITSSQYEPYILSGMLLQVDPDRKPKADEAQERAVFVLVRRPGTETPVLRVVHAFDSLILYAAMSEPDPYPFYHPDDWEYGGMVVMRLIP